MCNLSPLRVQTLTAMKWQGSELFCPIEGFLRQMRQALHLAKALHFHISSCIHLSYIRIQMNLPFCLETQQFQKFIRRELTARARGEEGQLDYLPDDWAAGPGLCGKMVPSQF